MIYEIVSAQFSSSEQLNHALRSLRQVGVIGHPGDLPYAGSGRGATLHLSVQPSRTQLVQDILRRAGGRL
jgi:hypothetical protein